MTSLDARAASLTFALSVLVAIDLAIAGGIAVAAAPPAAVASVCALPLAVAILARPELGALGVLLTVGLIPRDQLVAFNVPGPVPLNPVDVLLAWTLASWALGVARGHTPLAMPRWPLVSLGVLLALGAIAVLTAHELGTGYNVSALELRGLAVYLLILPLASGFQRDRAAVSRTLVVLLGAALVSAGEALRAFISTGGAHYSGDVVIGRVTGDAFLLPTLAMLFLVAHAGHRPSGARRWPVVLLIAIMAVALYTTFQRGAWLAVIAGLAVLFVVLPRRGRRRLAVSAAGLVLACTVALMIDWVPAQGPGNPLAVASKRLLSAGDVHDISNQYRLHEWARAIEVVRTRPVTGIGLGSSIRFWSPLYDPTTSRLGGVTETFYIHNSYIWVALKLGLGGLLALLSLVGWGVVAGIRALRRLTDDHARTVVAASTSGLVAMLVLAYSGPHLTLDRSAAFVAAMLAAIVGMTCRPRPAS